MKLLLFAGKNKPSIAWLAITVALLSCCAAPAIAEDWSDNSISWRYGDQFREPFNNQVISKNIVSLTHASGYKYGSNFLNIDVLKSDSKDPSSATSTSGALETYVVYRHTLDIGKISGRDIKFAAVRGFGITGGFDFNVKGDAGYNSKKRMLVLGPTLMMDVPGFLNVSLLALWESNNPSISAGAFNPGYPGHRYYYDTHPMLNAVWAIPLGSLPVSFEGYANFIAAKGRDETGHNTAPETSIDMQLMYDLGAVLGVAKNTFRAGFEYQYWHNKFGNSDSTVAPSGGNTAHTPMIRAEYHF
jgi:nucleoside-specific outer membrane channel protein Tsx